MMKKVYLLFYYSLAQYLTTQPYPGFKLYHRLRYMPCKKLLEESGENDLVNNKCYIGDGSRLWIGSNTQLGQNARLGGGNLIWWECNDEPECNNNACHA